MIVPIVLGVGLYALATQPRVRRHELRVGTTGSSTEPCSETTLSAEEIYDRLRAGTGHAAVNSARDEITQLTGKYAERLSGVQDLTSRMAESWHGDAADGAARYSRPAAEVLESSRERLDESVCADGPLARQSDAYQTVLAAVVKLPPKPESGLIDKFNPLDTDVERDIRAYNDHAARNIAAYADYYAASGENGRAMPHEFPVPQRLSESPSGPTPTIVVVPADHDTSTGSRSSHVPLPLVAADGAPPTVVASAPVADASPGIPPGYDVPGGTGPQSWPADAGRPVAPVGSAPAAAALPPGPGGAGGLFSLPSEGIGAGRAGGPGRPGGPGGAVENGPRTQGGAESRGRGGVAGPTGTERGGAVGGAAPGTRRGKNTDDEERKTKYLEDEDLGTQWGTTGFVAPPVIGDKR